MSEKLWHKIKDRNVDKPEHHGVYWIAILTKYKYHIDDPGMWKEAYQLEVKPAKWDGRNWLEVNPASMPQEWDGEWGSSTYYPSAWTDYSGAGEPGAPVWLRLMQPQREMFSGNG